MKCTLMFSPKLGNFLVLHTNSSLSKMSNPLDMHLGMFLFIYRKLSTRKSVILNG